MGNYRRQTRRRGHGCRSSRPRRHTLGRSADLQPAWRPRQPQSRLQTGAPTWRHCGRMAGRADAPAWQQGWSNADGGWFSWCPWSVGMRREQRSGEVGRLNSPGTPRGARSMGFHPGRHGARLGRRGRDGSPFFNRFRRARQTHMRVAAGDDPHEDHRRCGGGNPASAGVRRSPAAAGGWESGRRPRI